MFLENQSDWDELVDVLLKQKYIGFDTEFEGVDFSKKESCVNNAKIDIWSIAIFNGKYHPRDYSMAEGCTLPVEAIPTLKPILESPNIYKVAHNSNVDRHAMKNHGVRMQGLINTLSFARWVLPGLESYTLENLCSEYLGVGKADSFDDIFGYDNLQWVNVPKKAKKCFCGKIGCRLRKPPHDTKIEITVDNLVQKKVGRSFIPLHSVRPDHPLWTRYEKYACVDSIRSLELFDYLYRYGNSKKAEIIWYKRE